MYLYFSKFITAGEWRNWYTRTTQNRVPYGLRVRFPPRPPRMKPCSKRVRFFSWLMQGWGSNGNALKRIPRHPLAGQLMPDGMLAGGSLELARRFPPRPPKEWYVQMLSLQSSLLRPIAQKADRRAHQVYEPLVRCPLPLHGTRYKL